MVKIRKKKGKRERIGKRGKSERKGKMPEGSFTLPLLTDKADYTTTNTVTMIGCLIIIINYNRICGKMGRRFD